ncbi:MAG TPA: glycosyltransferase family 2 protein [Thermoplasmata archaeon]|nr:glycosyltransferase family 2 protein [Thermoplasmata archaeon]
MDVAIVLPTLNEAQGLLRTLSDLPIDRLSSLASENGRLVARLLMVDGGSTDGTLEIAREHGIPFLRQAGRGKGQAIRQALEWLYTKRVRYAVVLDADFTYPGSMIPAVVHLLDSGSQLVVGVRQPVRSAKEDRREVVHRIGNGMLNLAASQLSGLPILDLCSGFWGVLVDAVPPLALETDGFEIEAELFTKSYRAGYMVTQIPIPYRERVGVAKLRALRDGARILLTSIRFGRRRLVSALQLPGRSILRDILSIALVHGEDELVLIAHGSRRREAERIAASFRSSAPGTRVTVRPADEAATSVPLATTVAGRDPPAIMTLPAVDRTDPSPHAVVHLPRSGRIIAVGTAPEVPIGSGPRSVDELARSAGYRLRMSPGGGARSTSVRAVFASFFPSDERRELAFLGANGRHAPITVWESGSPEDPTPRPDLGGLPDHHSSQSHTEVLVEEAVH